MKKSIFLFILIILILSIPSSAEETQNEENVPKEQPNLKPQDIKGMSNTDVLNNYDQIAANPTLVKKLSSDHLEHLEKNKGYNSLRDKGVLKELNDAQLLDSGIVENQMKKPEGFNLNDIDQKYRADIVADLTEVEDYKQTSGNVVLKQGKDGSVTFSAEQATATIKSEGTTMDLKETNGEIRTETNPDGTKKLIVDGRSKQISATPKPPAKNLEEQPPNVEENPDSGSEPKKNLDKKNPIGGSKGDVYISDGDEPESGKDEDDKKDPKQNPGQKPTPGQGFTPTAFPPTSFTGGNIQNFEIVGDEIRADYADNIILSRTQGIIEVSNNVTNFTANSTHFGVGTAESVIVDGIRINGARKAKFSFLVKDGEQYMKLTHKEPSTHIITDKAGNTVTFTSGGDGYIAISLDDSKVKYFINRGKTQIQPDIKQQGESYTETIDAEDSVAEAIIENGNGITYLKLLPPASYIFQPDSLEKTFALQAQHEVHEIFFVKNGARAKNNCQSCTIVDFVEKRIKINGQLTYKRFFFKMEGNNPNLMEPTLQNVLIPENPIYAILDYDNELRFVEMLSIRENNGQFRVNPTNYLNLRFEGRLNGDNVQGEVFAKMKPTSVKQTPTPIFHKIANIGNTPIQYIDDPRSNKKVLAMGTVFFYPMSHTGINPFIDELKRTCELPAK